MSRVEERVRITDAVIDVGLQPLVIPLVEGVEEFWGYFEDSEGHIWHVKATKTGQKKERGIK